FANDDYLRIRWTVINLPFALSVLTATFVVKANEADPNSATVISKTITSTDSPDVGQIEDAGTNQTARLRFDLPPTDTNKLAPNVKYVYWCTVTLSTGEFSTIEKGEIFSFQGFSHV